MLPAVFLDNEDVRGLHVPVDEPARVRGIEGRSDLAHERERTHVIERRVVSEQRAQVGPST